MYTHLFQVKIRALNDSKLIGICIYNIVVLSIIGAIVLFVTDDNVDLSYGFSSALIIIGTTLTSNIVFAPKVSICSIGVVYYWQLNDMVPRDMLFLKWIALGKTVLWERLHAYEKCYIEDEWYNNTWIILRGSMQCSMTLRTNCCQITTRLQE